MTLFLSPEARRHRREEHRRNVEFQQLRRTVDADFDTARGIDTGGKIELDCLSVVGDASNDGTHYQAVFPERFREALESLTIEYGDYTFIDFGSGKGRAVLLAAQYPFQKVIGVEFAEELHRTAELNWHSYVRQPEVCCRVAEWHCMDAVAFPLPANPLVIYLYNPFGSTVMSKLIENVIRSCNSNPRSIYVLYLNPVIGHLWEAVPHVVTVWSGSFGKAYRLATTSSDL